MEESDIQRLHELKAENACLKSMFAVLSLEHQILKEMVEKSFETERRHLLAIEVDTLLPPKREVMCWRGWPVGEAIHAVVGSITDPNLWPAP